MHGFTMVLLGVKQKSFGFDMVLLRVQRKHGFTLVLLRVELKALVLHWFCLGSNEKTGVAMVLLNVQRTSNGFICVLLMVPRKKHWFYIGLA